MDQTRKPAPWRVTGRSWRRDVILWVLAGVVMVVFVYPRGQSSAWLIDDTLPVATGARDPEQESAWA